MADDIKILIRTILADKQFKKGMKGMNTGFDKATKKSKSFFKSIKAGWLIIGVGIFAVIKGFKKLITAAGDAQEVFSKFNTVFKDVRKEADLVAKNLARNFGLSSIKARELLSDTGDLLTGFGFTQKASLDLAKQVNELAVDLASFTNFSGGAEGASKALTKALLGERESVKSLGISILEADVKAKVLLNTQKGLIFASERQAKAYATLQIAQEQSKNAQGDFARTHKDFNNQVRILNSNLEEWAVKLGSRILPIFAPFVTALNKVLKPSRDIEDITQDLIKSQITYKEIVDRLSDSQLNLSKSERQLLQIRRDITELDIISDLDKLNKIYDEQVEAVKLATNRSKLFGDALEILNSKIADSKDEMIELTADEITFLRIQPKLVKGIDGEWHAMVKRTKVLKIHTQLEVDRLKLKADAIAKNLKLENSISAIASALIDEIVVKSQLLGLNEELLKEIKLRQKALLSEAKVKKEINETELQETDEHLTKLKEFRDEYTEYLNTERENELLREVGKYEDLVKMADKFGADSEKLTKIYIKKIEKIEDKYRKDKVEKDTKMEKLRKEISDTFVSGFLDGIDTMKSSSQDVLVSMIKSFTSFIAGKLSALASLYFVEGLIPAGIAALAAAGTVKALGGTIAAKVASFQEGTEFVPSTGLKLIHSGERVIPAGLNPPSMSNKELISAALANVNLPSNQNVGNTVDNSRSFEDNRSFSINNESQEGMGFEEFLNETEMMDTRWNRR